MRQKMIIQLQEQQCTNRGCKQKLDNGRNVGGWKSVKTQNGRRSGYICKQCGNQSVPTTNKLRLWQQTHYYTTPEHNVTNKTIQHKRQWRNLTASLAKDEGRKTPKTRMPEWNAVLDGMEAKTKKEAKGD